MCSQLRTILQWGETMKLWFAWAFDAQGNISNEFVQQFVQQFVPVGAVIFFPYNASAEGWLVANGQEVSKATYPKLFALCGTNFGTASNPTDNFKLPDLRDRFPIGQSGTYPFYVLGGEAAHTLTVPEMPAHTHTVIPFDMPIQGFLPGSGTRDLGPGNDTGDVTLSTTGGGGAHNNIPPYVPGFFLIKAG